MPKGFFPQQDTGRLMGAVQADQDTSFQSMSDRLTQFVAIIKTDPAVDQRDRIRRRQRGNQQPDMFIASSR